MRYADLVENFNALCEKCNKAIARANDEISKRTCLEVELAGLRDELKKTYSEISVLKHQLKQERL